MINRADMKFRNNFVYLISDSGLTFNINEKNFMLINTFLTLAIFSKISYINLKRNKKR